MFSTSKDKIDNVYDSLQSYLKIKYDRELYKYLGIYLDRHPYGSINLRQNFLTQRIVNLIPGMDKSSANPNTAVKPPQAKNEVTQPRINDLNYRSVIISLNYLTKSTCPKVKCAVHYCTQLRTDPNILHDQTDKLILKYPKGTDTQGLVLNFDPEKRIECYVNDEFPGSLNKEEGTDLVLVLSITGYIITYTIRLNIWARRLQM